jgi:hypothetical protein
VPIKNLYLHIGRGKTGSTAIQRFLSVHRAELLAVGMHYVAAGDVARMGHQSFAKSFIRQPPPYMEMPAHAERAREEVREELTGSGSPNALLSSENLTLAEIGELAHFCREAAPAARVRIIFFARSQDELVESQYNQMIKLALCRKTFADYLESDLDELDFSALLAPWAAQFGKENIIAQVFDAAGERVLDDFLRCLPLPAKFAIEPERDAASSNSSVGYLALRIFRTLNEFEFPEQRRFYQRLNEIILPFDQPALFFDSRQARAFRDRFRASNEWFLREYLGREGSDLGGRKYSDGERDRICAAIRNLRTSGKS